jgi:hypothetical protein
MRLLVSKTILMTHRCGGILTVARARTAVLPALILLAGCAAARAQAPEPPGTDLCKAIPDHQMRARCYGMLNAFGNQAGGYRAELPSGWHLSGTQDANSGASLFSLMHAADFRKSDLNFAGIVLRCASGPIEVLLAVIEPYPPRARVNVTLKLDETPELSFVGNVVPPGAMIRLPPEGAAYLSQRIHSVRELRVQLFYEKKLETKGAVDLVGFSDAIDSLKSKCPIP